MKPKNKGRWLTAGAMAYAGVVSAGLTAAVISDSERVPEPPPVQVVVPPEVLDPAPMAPDLPPCPFDAIPAPPARQAAPDPVQTKTVGTVATGELNVRSTPAGKIVGQLYRGDQLELLERPTSGAGAGWLRFKGGWVAAKFVTESDNRKQSDLPEVVPAPFPFPLFPQR